MHLPSCIDVSSNPEGWNVFNDVGKAISRNFEGMGEFLIAIVPCDINEEIGLTINSAWASVDIINRLTMALNTAKSFGALPEDITQPLEKLAIAINEWWKDTGNEYWLVFLPPARLAYESLFWLNGQAPDYNAISFREVVANIRVVIEKHRI
jgi:hypothetical protein